MMIKTATCLLALGFLTACQSTTTTTKRETLREQNATRLASNTSASEPAPPAEGPTSVSANGHIDPDLVASPLFQRSAAGDP